MLEEAVLLSLLLSSPKFFFTSSSSSYPSSRLPQRERKNQSQEKKTDRQKEEKEAGKEREKVEEDQRELKAPLPFGHGSSGAIFFSFLLSLSLSHLSTLSSTHSSLFFFFFLKPLQMPLSLLAVGRSAPPELLRVSTSTGPQSSAKASPFLSSGKENFRRLTLLILIKAFS